MSDLDDFRKLTEFAESLTRKDELGFRDPTQAQKTANSILSVLGGHAFWHGSGGVRIRLHALTHVLIGFALGILAGAGGLWFRSESQAYMQAYFLGALTITLLWAAWKARYVLRKKIRLQNP